MKALETSRYSEDNTSCVIWTFCTDTSQDSKLKTLRIQIENFVIWFTGGRQIEHLHQSPTHFLQRKLTTIKPKRVLIDRYLHVLPKQTNELQEIFLILFWVTPWFFCRWNSTNNNIFKKPKHYLTQRYSLDLHVKMHTNTEHI